MKNIMEIKKALEILKNRHEYVVPNSDFDEAIGVAIEILEIKEKAESKIDKNEIINWINDSIKSDEIIDDFLRKKEEK